MTFATNGVIQASDLNAIISTGSPNVNNLWSVGSGTSGYGQSAIATVTKDQIIAASTWNSTYSAIVSMGNHQGTTLLPFRNASPQKDQIILVEPNTSANLSSINTNRLNAAAQGSTVIPANGTAVSAITWTDYLQITFNIQFANQNSLRYFFNAGGQMSLSFSHPASGGPTNINYALSELAADAGTMWLSSPTSGTISLSGLSWTGVKQIGGTYLPGVTIFPNRGFYALNNTPQILFQQTAGSGYYYYYYYGNSYIRVSASTNGTGLLSFIILCDELPNGSTVTAGTTSILSLRYPSTTYLTNSWGTPTVSNSITGV